MCNDVVLSAFAEKMVAAEGIEPTPKAYETFALPLSYAAEMVDRVGFEPTIPRLKGECLEPNLATDRILDLPGKFLL